MVNLLTLSTRGIGIRMSEIDPEAISNESSVWMEKFTHILEEFAIRCGRNSSGGLSCFEQRRYRLRFAV